MSFSESKEREIIVFLVYMHHFGDVEVKEQVSLLMEALHVTKKNVFQSFDRWQALLPYTKKTEALLSEVSQSYRPERLGLVEHAILQVATAEIQSDPQHFKRITADAIRLARKYASPEAGALVNALLDGLYRRSQGSLADGVAIQETMQALEAAEAEVHAVHELRLAGTHPPTML